MKKVLCLALLIAGFLSSAIAQAYEPRKNVIQATPLPTTCITSAFSNTGSNFWVNVSLTLTNNCGSTVDFQDASITFNDTTYLNGTSFWGNFYPLSYPDNQLTLMAQSTGSGSYLTSLKLHFPVEPWTNTLLADKQSFTLMYGAPKASYDSKSVQVYLNGSQPPVQTGEIDLTNATVKPANISQTFAIVNLVSNNQTTKVQVPWNSMQAVPGMAPGAYTVQAENLSDSQGNVFQGTATPSSVTVTANQKVASKITYSQVVTTGSVKVQVSALPAVLQGYNGVPTVTFKRTDTGATTSQALPWNATTTVSQLANNVSYSLSTPNINFNNNNCIASFNPATLVSSAQNPPTSRLTYNCTSIAQDKVPVNVSGLPTTLSSLALTFTPNNQSTPINATVPIANGSGSTTVTLTDGTIYTVSAATVSGYTATFSPQPLTATSTATETITFQKQSSGSGGRIIGYLPGWETPPSATALASAGYTHILVAFGVFSTSTPGQITPAFDTVSKAYIQSLHAAGIKVSLSIGGASSSLPNTTVNFHQVLSAASSASAFQQTFIQSFQSLMTQFGFDGIDFDIEQGFNAGGTFSQPQGDIAVLAAIINQLHTSNPNLLISLAPQVANISATSGFDATWGNYASLVMQTAPSLSWVGIQLYNTGCAFGIDQVCYDPNNTSSPNFAVAMSTDLLANWPKTNPSGQATGFQPYISMLNPSQVVIGFPAPNAQGAGDGAPVTPTTTIKRAIQCLRTASAGSGSCGTYVPPKAYPGIGGVFDWEVVHDQANNFLFASSLKACVIAGNCN